MLTDPCRLRKVEFFSNGAIFEGGAPRNKRIYALIISIVVSHAYATA